MPPPPRLQPLAPPLGPAQPARAPAAPAAPGVAFAAPNTALRATFVEGEHRVIIHTVEGLVKRGIVRDLDLLDDVIRLEPSAGSRIEQIPADRVKAIFFMLPPGSRQPAAEGKKIRVTFNDGRQVAGFSTDFKGAERGFFVVPADSRTNTARIYIYRSSVQALAEG